MCPKQDRVSHFQRLQMGIFGFSLETGAKNFAIIIIVLVTPQWGCVRPPVSVIINFLGEWVINPHPNLMTRRAGRLLLVWTLTIDLSGMGGPTRRNKSPTSIALRFTEPHKPLHHDKVAVTTERKNFAMAAT